MSGEKAKLYSSLISASSGAKCFTFWYHMYGSGIGQLNILVQSNRTAGGGAGQSQQKQMHLKWRLTGNQGNTWHRAAVAVGTHVLSAGSYTVSRLNLLRDTGTAAAVKRRVSCAREVSSMSHLPVIYSFCPMYDI